MRLDATTLRPGATTLDSTSLTDTRSAGFAQGLELVVAATYRSVAPLLGGVRRSMAERFGDHHRQHAAAFGRVAGEAARPEADERILAEVEPLLERAIGTGETALLELAQMLENQLAYTHASALTVLSDPRAVDLVVTVLPIEAQHAAVIGLALGRSVGAQFPTGAFEGDRLGSVTDPATGVDPLRYR